VTLAGGVQEHVPVAVNVKTVSAPADDVVGEQVTGVV
jgi:hypothetical protein